jgi:hypothetical protein
LILGDRYRVVRVLPGGSLGCSYEGVDASGRSVVLKVLPVGRDLHELMALVVGQATLSHPGLLTPIEVVDVPGGLVIVSELISGGSLASELVRRGTLPAMQVSKGAALVADALAALHAARQAHGDVKPANILLRPGGRPVLTDTGIRSWMTDAGVGWPVLSGTAGYIAPELADGGRPGAASDVYSLGALCWEALTGGPPTARSVRCPDVAGPLGDALGAALDHLPANRPTAAELSRELRSVLNVLPVPLTRHRAPPLAVVKARSTSRRRRSRRLCGTLATLCVTLLLAGLIVRTVGGGDRSARRVRTSPVRSCVTDRPAAPVETLVADALGTACLRMSWADGTLTIGGSPSRRFVLGQSGDELLIGDWGCQGASTPAVYRPVTGQVFEWDRWATSGQPVAPATVLDTGIRYGVATVVTSGTTRCEQVSVQWVQSSLETQ